MKSPACLLFLALLGAPSAQTGGLPPASFLPGDDPVVTQAGNQESPAVAIGGSTILAAWTDERSYPSVVTSQFYEFETASDVYAMRLDATGDPIDAVPFPLTQGRGAQGAPQIAWNGTHWLVAFESTDVNGTGYYYQSSLEAVRVSPTGQVLDAEPIKIRNVEPVGSSSWALASDGQDWAIAFQNSDANSALRVLRVTASGVVDMPPRLVVPSTYFLRTNAKLAWADGVYLFTWEEFSSTKALRLDASLNPLDPAPLDLLGGRSLRALTSDGSQFYGVWVETVVPAYVSTVKGSRISSAGVLLDGPQGRNVSVENAPTSPYSVSVTWDGAWFRLTWPFDGAVSVARVAPNGSVLDPGGVSVAGPTAGPTTALPGGGVFTAWSPFAGNEYDVLGAGIDASNAAGPSHVLSTGAPMQFRPDVAAGSDGFLFVFRSDVAGTNRILAQPVGLDGSPLTAGPVELDSGPRTAGPGTPSVAWNGSVYLATWSTPGGIVSQRVAQDGSLVDPAPFPVTGGFGPTEVSALGDTFLIVGRRYGFNIEIINTIGARVRGSDGAVLDPGGLLIGASFATSVSVTTFGTRWFAAWRANLTHDNPFGRTYGAFVEPDGTVQPQFAVSNGSSVAGGNRIFEVATASDGTTALVLQSAELSSGVETDLTGVLVQANGTVLPEANLTPWVGNQYAPRVAFDGTHYVVVYNEQKNRFALQTLDQLDARGDLFAMRIIVDGTKLDPEGFAFSLSEQAETHPNVAAAGRRTLLAGAVLCDAPSESYRVGYRVLDATSNAPPVAVASATARGGDVPLTIGFDSAGSLDPEATALSFAWDFGDGTTSTEAAPQHTYLVPGEYVATLTVTDTGGASTTNTARVEARTPNVLPVAIATATPTQGQAPLQVTLFGERSYDPDGALGNFEWRFSDGGTYWGTTAYHTFSSPGAHTATLRVYDDRGGVGTTTVVFHVTGERLGWPKGQPRRRL